MNKQKAWGELTEELVDKASRYGKQTIYLNGDVPRANNKLKVLLDMHTRPLKFEEIKKHDWVWHNKYQEYLNIVSVMPNGSEYCGNVPCFLTGHKGDYREYEYEEGTYYRCEPLSEV